MHLTSPKNIYLRLVDELHLLHIIEQNVSWLICLANGGFGGGGGAGGLTIFLGSKFFIIYLSLIIDNAFNSTLLGL